MKQQNRFGKKVNFLVFAVITVFSAVLVTSCFKESEVINPEVMEKINDVAFDFACYSITGRTATNGSKKPVVYYYPEELNFILNRYYWENGQRCYMAEKYLKSKTGVIEGLIFYNPNDDSGEWVEDLVILTEEQRIADEILEMEDALEQAEYVPEQLEKEIVEALSEEIQSTDYAGRDNKLKIMEFDKEIFIPQNAGDDFITIEAVEQTVKRCFYDSSYRLYKRELWNITSSMEGKLLEEELMTFEPEVYRPVKKTLRTESAYTVTEYNENALAIRSESYKTFEEDEKEVITQKYSWEYNKDDKVQTELCTLYFYDKDYKKLEYTFEKKYEFTYNDFAKEDSEDDDDSKDIPPDFEYYENGTLKMKNKYSAEMGTYTSQVFFENDMAIKTYYTKYKKEKDVYTQGKTVTRIKEYEE